MFLKNKNNIFKIRRSKVTDYAALILRRAIKEETTAIDCDRFTIRDADCRMISMLYPTFK